MVVPFALSIHTFINNVGAYVGFASIVGLALLVLLHFAQARETSTLRNRLEEASDRIVIARGPAVAGSARGRQPSARVARTADRHAGADRRGPRQGARRSPSAWRAAALVRLRARRARRGWQRRALASATRLITTGVTPAPRRDAGASRSSGRRTRTRRRRGGSRRRARRERALGARSRCAPTTRCSSRRQRPPRAATATTGRRSCRLWPPLAMPAATTPPPSPPPRVQIRQEPPRAAATGPVRAAATAALARPPAAPGAAGLRDHGRGRRGLLVVRTAAASPRPRPPRATAQVAGATSTRHR